MKKECLFAHNKVRAHHKAVPLKWADNPGGNETPTEWAKDMATSGIFMHAPNNNWGENIAMYGFMSKKPKLPCAEAVRLW